MSQRPLPPSPLNRTVLIRALGWMAILFVVVMYGGIVAQEVGLPTITVRLLTGVIVVVMFINTRRAWRRAMNYKG